MADYVFVFDADGDVRLFVSITDAIRVCSENPGWSWGY